MGRRGSQLALADRLGGVGDQQHLPLVLLDPRPLLVELPGDGVVTGLDHGAAEVPLGLELVERHARVLGQER